HDAQTPPEERSRAETISTTTHHEGDARALAEIRRRQTLRPQPIMRFVELQIAYREHRQSHRGKRDDKEPDRASRTHRGGSKSKLGCRARIAGAHFRAAHRQTSSSKARMSNVSPAARNKLATT